MHYVSLATSPHPYSLLFPTPLLLPRPTTKVVITITHMVRPEGEHLFCVMILRRVRLKVKYA